MLHQHVSIDTVAHIDAPVRYEARRSHKLGRSCSISPIDSP